MPKYEINGQVFETDRELTESELQQFTSQLGLLEARGEQGLKSLPMAGSAIGAAMTGGASLPITMMAAGAGGALGEAARQQITGQPLDTTEIAKEGALGATGEGFGALISKAAPSVVRAAKAGLGLEKQAPQQMFSLAERQAAQQTAQELGTTLPGSRVGGNFSQLLEGISRTGLGEGRFVAADKQLAEALTKEASNIVDSTASRVLSDKEAGDAVRATLEGAETAFKDKVAPFYAQIEQMGSSVPVTVSAVKEDAKKLLTEASKLSTTGAPIGIDKEAVQLLKEFADTKSTLTFPQAHDLRSKLITMKRDLGTKYEANSNLDRYLTQAISTINKQMDLAAGNLSPRLQKLYRGVNAEYKRVMETMYDNTVKTILNKSPERLGEAMARTGNVSEVLKVRSALQEAKRQGQDITVLEENLLQGYLKDITKGLDDSLDSFVTLSDKLKDRKFKRTYDVMMQINPTAKENMAKLMNTAKVAAKTNEPTILQGRGGVGGLMNTLTVLMGGAGYAAGGFGVAAPVAIGTLAVQGLAAKAMTSPTITNLLLAAERISQKQGVNAGLEFLRKSKPFSRWMGQELSRSEFGPKFGE